MFIFAILIGFYSYLIFFLGVSGIFTKNLILLSSLLYWSIGIYFLRKHTIQSLRIKRIDKSSFLILFLLFLTAIVNLIGALGPEISFDALWYHLTLPKLYIDNGSIFHIPGSLLYYSDMPKLTEMLYTVALVFSNEISAKLIHFFFGILVLVTIYKLSRKFVSQKLSLLAALVFYSNLVVGWESITANVDLARAFFEIISLSAFVNWYVSKSSKWLIISAVLMGFAISTKLLAIGSIIIFLTLIFYMHKNNLKSSLKYIFIFLVTTSIVGSPWLIFSFLNTGNPIYPFFDSRVDLTILGSSDYLKNFLELFLVSADPVSPIYLLVLPLLLFLYSKADEKFKLLYIYSFLALIILLIMPNIGGGRFILPYLPVFSVLCIYALKKSGYKIKTILIITVLIVSVSSIGYRFLANVKFIPSVFGRETKSQFLTKYLNFNFGDFYDTDNYFKNNIKLSDKVLLYGFHNLYYVNFPFIHSSWVKKGDMFNYIAAQNSQIPEKYTHWKLIYYNDITNIKLYTNKGEMWIY